MDADDLVNHWGAASTGSGAALRAQNDYLLAEGTRVRLQSSTSVARVGRVLGEGGQGAVYELEHDGVLLALKWYHRHSASPAQREALLNLIDRGSPDPRFLWPIDLAEPLDAGGGFGYTMPLRPPDHAGLVDIVSRRVDVDFRTIATIGLELAHSFLLLHNEGLCYRDISFGNVFFDPRTGRVQICDIDNVGIDGRSESNVRGTPYFMAPEIVRGEAMPSRNTDLFSLSVLLFYLLMIHHPLEGRRALEHACWNKEAMDDLFGRRPLFVFDPHDRSNEPVEGQHDNATIYWPLYPSFVRATFVEAFTRGLHDPVDGRVRESVWRATLARLRDLIVYCQSCAVQNFHDPDEGAPRCWSCDEQVFVPPLLDFGWTTVVLNHDTELFPHHLRRDYDFSSPVGAVQPHPERPGVWGLRNCSSKPWTVLMADGREKLVAPDRSIAITPGMRVTFGRAEATVRLPGPGRPPVGPSAADPTSWSSF